MEHPPCYNRTPVGTHKRVSSDAAGNDDLIEIVNELQNKLASCGQTLDISLPQIVVVGCQSAGKSSVLENIVGREFLPRGSGVVTRRPTVVQLLESEDEEYAVFLHRPDEIFYDFEQVRDEIKNETLKDPGPVGFSSEPISLKIFSPNVLKLTLVDLPGLIRVTVDNQSEDSIAQVRNMVMQYIQQPNSLILAISPANQDLANSDALEIAKTVDPERVRTIGVLTKLDLMDEGTDSRDILENKKIPLKRGYIGVLNRSQKDIDEGKDFTYCLQKEKNFFKGKPCYQDLADKMGTPYLKTFLNKQLYTHIKESLPGVRQQLLQKMTTFQQMLRDFKSKIGYNSESKSIQFYMIKLIEKFIDDVLTYVFGYSENVTFDGLSAGSIINYKLNTNVKKLKLPQVPDEAHLSVLVANLHGTRNSLSLPSLALDIVTQKVLSQYIDPLNNLVDNITDTLLSSVEQCSKMIDSYPNLKNEILYFVTKNIHEASFETKEYLEKHMKAEMYFVNTYHSDFAFPEVKGDKKLFPLHLWDKSDSDIAVSPSKISGNSCEAAEAVETLASNNTVKENAHYLAKTIENYLTIQHKIVGDTAIKYISFFLVKSAMDFVKMELIPTILESADIESIYKDCEEDFDRMNKIKETCKCLEDSLIAVQYF